MAHRTKQSGRLLCAVIGGFAAPANLHPALRATFSRREKEHSRCFLI
jgi:hypothetical protein